MKRCFLLALFCILLLSGCGGIKITKPMLRMIVSGNDKVSTEPAYADSLEIRIGVPKAFYAEAIKRQNENL